MILLIDNYDSFTYNLVQRIGELHLDRGLDVPDLRVVRNDKLTADDAEAMHPAYVIISPGPCTPREAGVSGEVIQRFAGRVPILGVCLGHQCIGDSHGMTVDRADRLMHGKTSTVHHDGRGVFAGLPNPLTANRYHSLIVRRETVDSGRFEITAWTDEDEVMGLRSLPDAFAGDAPVEGVQFHPESFLTPDGTAMLANFLGVDAPTAAAPAG
jgi:anthranilate synthase/aminodeoxychorismate synthase-like glutamine amidotransferase